MSGVENKKLRVAYFALLREERGCEHEELATSAATPGERGVGLMGMAGM